MVPKIRVWQRDIDILEAVKRWPMTTSLIALLHGFPSLKKCAQRLCLLHRAGFVQRVPYFQPAKQGKPEFVYFVGPRPRDHLLRHTIGIAALHVQIALWLRTVAWRGEFSYTNETSTSGGIIPDATLTLSNGEKHGLFFFEIDNGTETLNGTGAYSLAKKLRLYAAYFDSEGYVRDFAPKYRGFRVCVIAPAGRLPHLQHLIAREQHDFVLLTSFDRSNAAFGQQIWLNSDQDTVDLLGRQGEVLGDSVGEMIGPQLPSTDATKANDINIFRSGVEAETPTATGRTKKER